ncbi:MAG: peptidyl-prolyl cis-trans isomerase [bacterium]
MSLSKSYHRIDFFFLAVVVLFIPVTSSCISSLRPKSKVIARIDNFLITGDDLMEELRRFHLRMMRSGQATNLDISGFLNELIDRRLIIQEAQRMGLDRDPGFRRALADEKERICLELLRREKIEKPAGSLTQEDIDSYFQATGQPSPRLSNLSRIEAHKVKMWKEEKHSQAYVQELRQRAKIEIFESRMADPTALRKSSDPVALVNGEDIRGQDLFEGITARDDAGPSATGTRKELDRLIGYWLLRQEANRLGYPARKEVKDHMRRYEEDLLYRTLCQKVIASKVQVEREEIERYYQDNRSNFTTDTMVSLDEIRVRDPNSAREIHRELLQGADFAFLASQRASELPGGQPDSGKWVSVQKMRPELKLLVSDLKEGEISAPVRLGEEYSIFRVKGKKGGEQIPLEKARVWIEQEIGGMKARSVTQELVQRLRADSKVVIDERNLRELTSAYQP